MNHLDRMSTRLLVGGLFCLALASCAGRPDDNPGLTYMKSKDPGLKQVGEWTVTCLGGRPNAVGRVDLPGHCRIEKHDFLAVAKVDSSGSKIVTALPASDACPFPAVHAAVDGKPIENLPLDQQLAALRRGRVFTREVQAPWPSCFVSFEETSLEWFFEAYTLMMQRWWLFKWTVRE